MICIIKIGMIIYHDSSFFIDFFFYLYGHHRDLHVLTHSCPTRRSADLRAQGLENPVDRQNPRGLSDRADQAGSGHAHVRERPRSRAARGADLLSQDRNVEIIERGSGMKGPAIFLAQFMGDAAPFDTLPSAARWMADAGYAGVQIPTWDRR